MQISVGLAREDDMIVGVVGSKLRLKLRVMVSVWGPVVGWLRNDWCGDGCNSISRRPKRHHTKT